jgi:hypothetical protein
MMSFKKLLHIAPGLLRPLSLLCALLTPSLGVADATGDSTRIQRAVDQMLRSQLASGYFPYGFNFNNGATVDMNDPSGANLVRQAGGAFALAEYEAMTGTGSALDAVGKYLDVAARHSVPVSKSDSQALLEDIGLFDRWQLWGLLSPPLDALGLLYQQQGNGALASFGEDYERAEPGATALTLLAALYHYQETGDSRFIPMMKAWEGGLRVLAVPSRGFRYRLSELQENGYVNGEAWLAYALYHKLFPEDAEVSAELARLDHYLMDRYAAPANQQFYHWGARAADIRLATTDDPRYADFLVELTRQYLDELTIETLEYTNCAHMEGLGTFLAVSAERETVAEAALRQRAASYFNNSMDFNRAAQLDGDSADVMPIAPEFAEQLPLFEGGFVMGPSMPTVRVDITQHCLSALLLGQRAGIDR